MYTRNFKKPDQLPTTTEKKTKAKPTAKANAAVGKGKHASKPKDGGGSGPSSIASSISTASSYAASASISSTTSSRSIRSLTTTEEGSCSPLLSVSCADNLSLAHDYHEPVAVEFERESKAKEKAEAEILRIQGEKFLADWKNFGEMDFILYDTRRRTFDIEWRDLEAEDKANERKLSDNDGFPKPYQSPPQKIRLTDFVCSKKDKVSSTADQFALAGFSFNFDKIQCFVCHKKKDVKTIRENVDPWELHAEISPDCPLLKLGTRTEADDYTMEEVIYLVGEIKVFKMEEKFEEMEKATLEHLDKLESEFLF